MRFADRPGDLRRLRPRRSVLHQSIGATLAFLVPVSVVLYALTIPGGPWPLVVALQSIVIVASIGAYFAYSRVGFWVGPSGIAERGFFGRSTFVSRDTIGSIVLVDTYGLDGGAAIAQLFVCNERGAQLMRMRGQFWSRDSMQLVCETLDIPATTLSDEVTRTELLEDHPGLLYWFERHPVLVAVATAGAIITGVLLALIAWVLGAQP